MPRMLSIVFIIFLSLFSLDVFNEKSGFWQILAGLFLHNILALIFLIVLIISWKHEIVGGIIFISAGIFYIIFAFSHADSWKVALEWSIQIAGSVFVIGGLFITNWIEKRN